jgi:polyisoprenoid-binding protein YceI
MKGPKVLDAETWPEITFLSSAVRGEGDGALVDGALTIRGVTRPVTLNASLYRQRGTAPGDLSQLTIRLTGAVNRSDYGATGWSDMVGDQVRIDILARIRQAD